MNAPVPAYNLTPALGILVAGVTLALGPLLWFWLRRRGTSAAARLRALALLTLFLSFDLVLLGAFTRLTDSGLGCPDWPGCYGHASPIGAQAPIVAAEIAVPTGAVTPTKAWIEMAHRYSATAIGVLVVVLAVLALVEWRRGRIAVSPGWAVATVVWMVAQGAFGALTVTMGLYPGIVTLHLLGGLGLLALLAIQSDAYEPRPLRLSPVLRSALLVVAALALVQIALGGWVSTNYAVLACREFPTCQGAWWPDMNFAEAFVLRRPLGISGNGGFLPFSALTAIHMAHRLGAYVMLPAILLLAWRLAAGGGAAARPWAQALAGIALWQLASGLGNVLLGWPLVAAVAHTAGSAALVVVMTILVTRSWPTGQRVESAWPPNHLRQAS
ncbi:MAG: COX15/CtaA family protein [Pseudomonadota bacterium]|nr:COX15/CtaA family protein [Pseudomonadota bacterium]